MKNILKLDLKACKDKTYRVHNHGESSTIIEEFTGTSDLTDFNRDEDVREFGNL